MRFSISKPKSAVGVEIGSYTIRVAEISGKSIPSSLIHYCEEQTERGSVIDGEVVEVEKVAETLKNIWAKGGISSRNVVVGIANPKILVRQIDLPYMSDEMLNGAIKFQAQEYIPIPLDDLILDYQIIGEYVNEAEQKMIEVLLVGAHREMVKRFCEAIEMAGLTVDVVYLSSLALVRSLVPDGLADVISNEKTVGEISPEPNPKEDHTVLVNMSADVTNIVVIEKGIPRFARIMAFGGNDFTNSIISSLNIDYDEAEKMKKEIGLRILDEYSEIDQNVKIASELIRRESFRFAEELRRSIEYYFGQELFNINIKKLILCGGGSEMINLSEFIATALRMEVENGRPLNQLTVAGSVDKQLVETHESALSAVIGLALRGLEEL